MASSTGITEKCKLMGSKQFQPQEIKTLRGSPHTHVPARRGRGTPPTNIVFLGSNGWEPSITKSLSFRFQGLIWTYKNQDGKKTLFSSGSIVSKIHFGLWKWKPLAAYVIWINECLWFNLSALEMHQMVRSQFLHLSSFVLWGRIMQHLQNITEWIN